jgi:hypothetical protein
MTSEAFVYFLPAYLVEALDAYEDRDSSIPEDLVHQLTRDRDAADFERRFNLLTESEKVAVARVLGVMRELALQEGPFLVSRIDAAIASAWAPYLPPRSPNPG